MYYKEAHAAWKRERMKNPEIRARANMLRRERYSKDPVARAKKVADSAAWAKRNPEKRRVMRLKIEWKNRGVPNPTRPMPDKCEVCGDVPSNGRALHNDHNHLTGAFRGWLCVRCNHALGLLKDSPERCLALARYARAESLQ